jgi:hypothetical protein
MSTYDAKNEEKTQTNLFKQRFLKHSDQGLIKISIIEYSYWSIN